MNLNMRNKINSQEQIGAVAATFLTVSNMLGSGIFMLPATLALIGGVSVLGYLVAIIGVVSLALVFAKLALLVPNGAGPYTYTRRAFGDYLAYQTNFIYSVASWIGNVSMLSVVLGYLAHIFPLFANPVYSLLTQIMLIWIFTLLNIYGAKVVSFIQGISLVVALIPIVLIATIGWHWFSFDVFLAGWNIQHYSTFHAVNLSFNNIMWAFIGIESACISTKLIKNPKQNVPLATISGVLIVAFLYISSCMVIMGIVPNHDLVTSSAPFAIAFEYIIGNNLSILISGCAIINCLGALAGWTMVIGQTTKAAASDGLFPKVFSKTNRHGIPALGLVILAVIMSLVVIITISPSASQQFYKIITMSVVLYLIPYIYCGCAVILLGAAQLPLKTYIMYVIMGIIVTLFCIWSILGSENSITIWAFVVMLLSTLFYSFKR
jgi:arginine:agmatine antiporter